MQRIGKRVALFDVYETRTIEGYDYPLRRVMRVIERTIDKPTANNVGDFFC